MTNDKMIYYELMIFRYSTANLWISHKEPLFTLTPKLKGEGYHPFALNTFVSDLSKIWNELINGSDEHPLGVKTLGYGLVTSVVVRHEEYQMVIEVNGTEHICAASCVSMSPEYAEKLLLLRVDDE